MRKLTLMLAAAALLVVPAGAMAQTSASGNAGVRARVYAPLSMTVSGGNMVVGGVQTLDLGVAATGSATTLTRDASDANALVFDAQGQASVPLTVTVTAPVNLTGTGADVLPLTTYWLGADTNTKPAGVGSTTKPTTATLGAGGHYYWWMGASVTVGAGVTVTGVYNGTVTVAVAY